MKRVIWHDYLRAFEVLYGSYVSVDPCEAWDEDGGNFILKSPALNPERMLIRKESLESLSSEALEMIDTILNAPDEILDLLKTPKSRRITKPRVRKYFYSVWNSRFITNITIKEVSRWVNQL